MNNCPNVDRLRSRTRKISCSHNFCQETNSLSPIRQAIVFLSALRGHRMRSCPAELSQRRHFVPGAADQKRHLLTICEARAGSLDPALIVAKLRLPSYVCFLHLELESTGELNRSTLYRGSCDLTDAGVRSSRAQRGWIELVGGRCEAWMVG
jgi:hypothetical protein